MVMTKLLDKAMEAVRALPPEMQDEIARIVLDMTRIDHDHEPRQGEHVAAVLEGLFQFQSCPLSVGDKVEAALRGEQR